MPVNSQVYDPEDAGEKKYFQKQGIPLRDKRAYLILKRMTDIGFSLFVIVFIFPWLLPLLIIAIRLNSRGPVFFKQERIGYKGTTFICLKLRTMYVNNFAHTKQAVRNDPRITCVGTFLRNSGLDELPQFLNILAGHMSIVGPRPHMLRDHLDFSMLIPGYDCRNSVRPGITGMSQVKGYCGPAVDFESIYRRYLWDSYYVEHIGFMLDCTIIYKTILVMVKSILTRDRIVVTAIPDHLQDRTADEPVNTHPAQPSLSKLRY